MKSIVTLKFSVKALSIGIISIMLSACGEETEHIPPAMNQPESIPPTVKPPVIKSPEPTTPLIPLEPIECRGKPVQVRCDNRPEYISNALKDWALDQGITISYIELGNPQ